jgi:hypothetical protein
MTEQTDTPISANTFPRPPRMDQVKAFIGDLARPFAIISTSFAASVATVVVSTKIGPDASAAAIFIGAVFAGVGALYGAKAWEAVQSGKHIASVEIAKTTTAAEPPK